MVKSVNREVLLYVDDTPLRYFISMKMQNKCKIRVSLSVLEKEHLSKFRRKVVTQIAKIKLL